MTAEGLSLSLRAPVWSPPPSEMRLLRCTLQGWVTFASCVCVQTSLLPELCPFFHHYPKTHFLGSFTAWLPHLSHVLLIKPEEVGISGIKCGGSGEQGSTKQRADQVSQGQVSGMPMFSSFNVLINDLGTKISLMLMKCSRDAML